MSVRNLMGDVRLCYATAAIGAGAVVTFLLSPIGSAPHIVGLFLPHVLAAVLLTARIGHTPAAMGRPLRVLLAAQLTYFAATTVYYLSPVVFDVQLPFPSLLDPLFFIAYGLYAAFLVIVLRRQAPQNPTTARLAGTDALIVTSSVSTAVWVAIISPQLGIGVTWLATTVTVLYQAFPLLLLGLACRIAINGGTLRTLVGVLMLLWIGAEVLGDIFYGFQSANGTFEYGGILGATWVLSSVALASLAAHPDVVSLLDRRTSTKRGTSAGPTTKGNALRLVILSIAVLVPITLTALSRHPSLALWAASAITFILVIYRILLLTRALELQSRDLERLAFQDAVTGHGNRAFLRAAADARGPGDDAAVVLLDLDGFKEVNDTLGRPAGDELLVQVADRIKSCVRAADTVARLGGDEFALLLAETDRRLAERTAERVLAQLRAPFNVAGSTVYVHGSIGIALATECSDLDQLLRDADLAMYEAKGGGGDRSEVFHPVMHERVVRRLDMNTSLRAAFGEGEFSVSYQPIVAGESGDVTCLEALVRWQHPQRGTLPPLEFLEVAESTGLIVELGRFVLRTACEQVAAWRAQWPDLAVAVNVSHRELLDPGFVANVGHVLATTGLPAEALHLEITETVLLADREIGRVLQSLDELGVQFAIDDFGTGHSSLSRLRDLAVSRVKIDRSFIAEIGSDLAAPFLASIINLGHSLGLVVVAEGVETPQQAAFLIAHGCDELQGYLFGHPIAAPHIPALLWERNAPSRVRGPHATIPRPRRSLAGRADARRAAGAAGSVDPNSTSVVLDNL